MMFAEQIDVYTSKGMLLPLDELLGESDVNLEERYALPLSWASRAEALLSKGDL